MELAESDLHQRLDRFLHLYQSKKKEQFWVLSSLCWSLFDAVGAVLKVIAAMQGTITM